MIPLSMSQQAILGAVARGVDFDNDPVTQVYSRPVRTKALAKLFAAGLVTSAQEGAATLTEAGRTRHAAPPPAPQMPAWVPPVPAPIRAGAERAHQLPSLCAGRLERHRVSTAPCSVIAADFGDAAP